MGSFKGGIDMDALRIPPAELAELELACGNSALETWCQAVDRLAGFERKSLYVCGAARSSAYLSPWGDLNPCVSSPHLAYPLRQMTVADAWSRMGDEVCNRPMPADHPCRGCPSMAFCQNCPAVASLDTGDELGLSSSRCALAKARQKVYHSSLDKGKKEKR